MPGYMTPSTRDALSRMAGKLPTITIALGGRLLRLETPPGAMPQIGGAKRGCIVSYSRQSRKRLLEFFNSLDMEKVEHTPLFLTLTYPEVFPSDIQESKAQLFAFVKRVLRRYNNAAVVWRLEWQVRGAPHYHLLVFNCPFIPHAEVAAWWYSTVNSADTRHLAAGTRIERIRTWAGVLYYASKYLGKLGAVPDGCRPGRLWGVVNRRALPRRLLVQDVAWKEFYAMRRVIWRREEMNARKTGRKSRYIGTTVFIPANDAIRLFAALMNEHPLDH